MQEISRKSYPLILNHITMHPMADDYLYPEKPVKKYRLLKDLPGVPAGTEVEIEDGNGYVTIVYNTCHYFKFYTTDRFNEKEWIEPVIDYKAELIALCYEIQFYPSGYTEPFVTAYRQLTDKKYPAIKFYAKDLEQLYQVVTQNTK